MGEYRIFLAIIAMLSIDTLVNALLELGVTASCQVAPLQRIRGFLKNFSTLTACSHHE